MQTFIIFILIGLAGGTISGLTGLGGGIVMIPMMIYILGYSQLQAQGTNLALMVPPIGLLAAWTYFKEGYVDITAAMICCAGFFLGGLFGAKIAVYLPQDLMRRMFGIILFFISIHMIFFKK